MIKAVIFDMDGLMIDSEPLHWKAYNSVLMGFGFSFMFKDYSKYFGVSDKDIITDLINKYKIKNISLKAFMEKKDKIYENYLIKKLKPKMGLISLVKNLSKKGFLLAVASSAHTKEIKIVLSKLKLDSFFNEIVSADNVDEAKPSPDIFILSAKKLRVLSENCLVLEDSPKGVIAAKSAGMFCYAIPSSDVKDDDNFKLADRILNNLSQVYDSINRDF
jgi:HAD superfamily hydrolase (TIGR01509 family)